MSYASLSVWIPLMLATIVESRPASFPDGQDCVGLVWIRSDADFNQVERDGALPLCVRVILPQQLFANGQRFFISR